MWKIFFLILFSTSALAQSAKIREYSYGSVMGGYQFFNTWVSEKITGSYTFIYTKDISYEFEYAHSKKELDTAGVELGTVDETRYSLLVKYYLTDTFYLAMGPYINELTIDLSKEIRDAAGVANTQDVEVSTLGVAFGIGNRWQYENGLTVGIDWLRINQPTGIYHVNNSALKDLEEDDKDDVKRTGRILRTMPAFTYLGVNVGYTF